MGRAALVVRGFERASAAPRALAVGRALLRAIHVDAFDALMRDEHSIAAMSVIRVTLPFLDFAGEIELGVLTGVFVHGVRLTGFR